MSTGHQNLIEKAKEILRQKGYREDEIHEDFGFKSHRIDVVGWSKDKKIAIECGHCDREKLRDLKDFFDEVIYLSYEDRIPPTTSDIESLEISRKLPFGRLAGMKLLLVKDEDVLFEVPLSLNDWSRDRLEDELADLEEEFNRFSKLFDALSNETRLMMMRRLMEEKDRTMSFADFMRDLDLNPKLVWENARKLREGGLVEKIGRGRYRCSEFGETGFMVMSLALRRLLEAMEEMERF